MSISFAGQLTGLISSSCSFPWHMCTQHAPSATRKSFFLYTFRALYTETGLALKIFLFHMSNRMACIETLCTERNLHSTCSTTLNDISKQTRAATSYVWTHCMAVVQELAGNDNTGCTSPNHSDGLLLFHGFARSSECGMCEPWSLKISGCTCGSEFFILSIGTRGHLPERRF